MLVVIGQNATAFYVNGKQWRIEHNSDDMFSHLSSLFLRKLVVIDKWDVIKIPELYAYPEMQNQLAGLYNEYDVPLYNGPESHGIDEVFIPEKDTKKVDPERLHVRWFAWFLPDKKHLVYIGDRTEIEEAIRKSDLENPPEPGTVSSSMYRRCWEYTRDIAVARGGANCTEFSANKFPEKEDILAKYKKSDTYVY